MKIELAMIAMMLVGQAPPSTKAPIPHKADSISILSTSNAALYCKAKPDGDAPIYRNGKWEEIGCSSFNSLLGGGMMDDEIDLLLSVLDLRIELQSKGSPK